MGRAGDRFHESVAIRLISVGEARATGERIGRIDAVEAACGIVAVARLMLGGGADQLPAAGAQEAVLFAIQLFCLSP